MLGEEQQLHLRVVEDALLGEDAACSLASFGTRLPAPPGSRAWSISAVSLAISSRRAAGSTETTTSSSWARISACSSSGSSSKSSGMRCSICCLPVGFGVGQDLLARCLHALQGPPDGVDARGHPALEHGHREADGPPAGESSADGPDRLVLDVAGQGVVEVEFVVVQLERRWS